MRVKKGGFHSCLLLTETGKELLKKYDREYFRKIQPFFDVISDDEAEVMMQTIEKMYQIMSERSISINER
ncbi:MAG: hypothetical protein SOZ30_06320 [Roseburia lenta]|nr:hypothetical protein [Roseburia lenta]